jgi:hypothetical protein
MSVGVVNTLVVAVVVMRGSVVQGQCRGAAAHLAVPLFVPHTSSEWGQWTQQGVVRVEGLSCVWGGQAWTRHVVAGSSVLDVLAIQRRNPRHRIIRWGPCLPHAAGASCSPVPTACTIDVRVL